MLLLWQNLNYFLALSSHWLIPFLALCLGLEFSLLSRQLKLNTALTRLWYKSNQPWFTRPLVLALGLFLFYSSLHYSTEHQIFFTPGYEINHDAIVITSGVKMLWQNLTPTNNPANYFGSLTQFFNYPTGGSLLVLSYVQLLNQDPFFIYSRIILAYFLTTIFLLAYLVRALAPKLAAPQPLILLTLTVSLLNYLTTNFINTAVLGSTLIIPLTLTAFILLVAWQRRQLPTPLFALLFTGQLTAAVFIYLYIAPLITGLFVIGLILVGFRFNSRQLLLLLLCFCLAHANPHHLLTSARYLHRQLTSTNRELNLFLGMKGNLPDFLAFPKLLSLWFLHPIYVAPAPHPYPQFLLPLGLILLGLYWLFTPHRRPSPLILGLITAAGLSLSSLLLVTRYLTHSPYQHGKLMQFVAPLIPVGLYLLFLPHLFARPARTSWPLLHRLSLSALLLLMLTSGLFAATYIGKPVLESTLELQTQATNWCNDPQALTANLVSRDEWAKYWLINCEQIYYYLDRTANWPGVVSLARHNGLYTIADPCTPHSWVMPTSFRFHDHYLILDTCLQFSDPNYQLTTTGYQYDLYTKTSQNQLLNNSPPPKPNR